MQFDIALNRFDAGDILLDGIDSHRVIELVYGLLEAQIKKARPLIRSAWHQAPRGTVFSFHWLSLLLTTRFFFRYKFALDRQLVGRKAHRLTRKLLINARDLKHDPAGLYNRHQYSGNLYRNPCGFRPASR